MNTSYSRLGFDFEKDDEGFDCEKEEEEATNSIEGTEVNGYNSMQ